MACLSEMPKDIIYGISYFLTNKEVAYMGMLSKYYWNLMRERPTLAYDYMKSSQGYDPDSTITIAKYRGEVRCLHSSLVRYCAENIDLETFIFRADWLLSREFHQEDFHLYDNCIALGIQKPGVRNLDLSMWNSYVLRVPAVMKSPEKFSARYCRLQIEGPVLRWPNLKRLCLIYAFLSSEAMFDNIVRGCPLLEDLEIDFFDLEGKVANLNFKVVNLCRLKKVRARLGPTQTLELTGAPDLESLACRFNLSLQFLEDLRSYSHRLDWIRQPHRHPNLTKLSLYNVRISEDYFLHLAQIFPKLVHLSVKCIKNLRKIRISSQTLKIIHLSFNRELEEAQFDVPSIAVFKFRLLYQFRMPKLSFTRTSKRWISRLRIKCYACIDTWWFVKLKDLILDAVKGSQTFLSIDFYERVIFDGWPIVNGFPMTISVIPEIEEFYTDSMPEGLSSSSSFQAVLENIFWICRPRSILFRNWGFYNFEHPRLLHEFLLSAAGTPDGWNCLSKSPCHCECVWNVTSIKVFRHVKSRDQIMLLDFYAYKEGLGLELLPGASDCNGFLELLKVHEENFMMICGFDLEWRTCGMHTPSLISISKYLKISG